MKFNHPSIAGQSGAGSTAILALTVIVVWASITGRLKNARNVLTGTIAGAESKTTAIQPIPGINIKLPDFPTLPRISGPIGGYLPKNPLDGSITITPTK
jgi:hypothetical protein